MMRETRFERIVKSSWPASHLQDGSVSQAGYCAKCETPKRGELPAGKTTALTADAMKVYKNSELIALPKW